MTRANYDIRKLWEIGSKTSKSTALSLPKDLCAKLGFDVGSSVRITQRDNTIVISSLDADYTPEPDPIPDVPAPVTAKSDATPKKEDDFW